MSNLISSAMLFALMIGVTTAFGAITPPPNAKNDVVLIHSKSVIFSMSSLHDVKSFKSVNFNSVTKFLEIDAKVNIAFVEILNEKGVLEYLMPVGSQFLRIDLLDFPSGSYTINLKFQELGNRIVTSSLLKSF